MVFDFVQALELMTKQRQKVRRAHWPYHWIQVIGAKFYAQYEGDVNRVEWTPTSEDVLAQDWRVALFPGEGVQQKLALVWD